MAKETLSVNVVEEKGEYRITIKGEKAADVVKKFLDNCCCKPAEVNARFIYERTSNREINRRSGLCRVDRTLRNR
jgi:hypothetical protein